MEIDKNWVNEYIKTHGNIIIIPKEATIIKQDAFDSANIDENEKIEVYFEEGSNIERIESMAFCFPISNRIIIPRNIKQIDCFAFHGFPIDVSIEDGSDIDICESDVPFIGLKTIKVPHRLKKLKLTYLLGHVDSIKIPSDSALENLKVTCDVDTITLASGRKLESSNEKKFTEIRLHNKKTVLIYEGKEKSYFYEVINEISGEKLSEGNYYNSSYDVFNKPIFEFNSIFDIDYDILNDDDFLIFKTDYNAYNEFYMNYGTREGAIYTLEEAKKIKDILMEIISKINIPPEHINDREKIIYAQIVQNLSSYLEYDFKGSDLIDKDKGIYYLSDADLNNTIDSTQNMKGLLHGKTVCKGMSTIVNSLATYFGINSRTVSNDEHSWNVVTLDGVDYEDDFTWYIDSLKAGTIPQITTFLNGSIDNNRSFEALPYHDLSENLTLGNGITNYQKLNLLGTDWSKVQDWERVNINKSNMLKYFMQQLYDLYKATILKKNNIDLGGNDGIYR